MKKIMLSLFVLSCCYACNGQKIINKDKALSATTPSELSEKIDAVVQSYMDLDIFSGVVLLAEKGKPIYHKAFGLADREKKTPNQLNTLFDIGSMNKTFTSIVVKQLVHEGKLTMEDKLVQHIPGFQQRDSDIITINHLLNHESGFGDYHDPSYFDAPKETKLLNGIVERAKGMPLFFPPGEDQQYSNTGYVLLGGVIEKVTGKSYFQNVKERIVEPLKLKNTYLNNFSGLESQTAWGYYHTPLGVLEKNDQFQDTPNPDGGFLSTTEDIMTFYRSYIYEEVLMTDEMKADDPFFQFVRGLPPGKAPSIAGGFEGFNSALFQVVSDDRTIIVFANMNEPVAEHIAIDILKITRGETPDPPQLPAEQNVRVHFEKHGAAYVQEHFEELTVSFHPTDPKDMILNSLGYAYLYEGKEVDKAIEIFKLNTLLFPEVGNCWDSLGEAYLNKGDKQKAKAAYQKALSINPDIPSAKKALEELK